MHRFSGPARSRGCVVRHFHSVRSHPRRHPRAVGRGGDSVSVRNSVEQDPLQDRAFLRRVVAASMAGTVVEWYEFFLYGTAATLVFSKVFFPRGGNELDAILAAFVTYAVGFAARPLGGVVF